MRKSPVLIAALLGSIGWAAHAQSQNDLSGTWNLTANATFGPAKGEVVDCQFTGQAQIMMETSSTFGGQAALTLSGGSQRCPAEMDADVDGTVANGVVQMSMLMGPLGTAQFSSGPGRKGQALQGGYSVTAGNFSGTSGSWTAVFAGTPAPQIVPAAGLWGLALLALLTLLAGGRFLARRPT